MAVFREIEIAWGDDTYTIVPSNAIIRRIEDKVSLAKFGARCNDGEPPISHLAYIAATLMQSAGASVTEDEMMAELQHGDPEEVVAFASTIVGAITPSEPDRKKLGGLAAKVQSKAKPKK